MPVPPALLAPQLKTSTSSSSESSDSSNSSRSSHHSSNTNKDNHSCEAIPSKKHKITPEKADDQDESLFVPDYDEVTSKKEEKTHLLIPTIKQTGPTLDGNDVKLLATATQGVAHQIMITNTNILQLGNRMDHLVNMIARKKDEVRPQDVNIGLKHLMGDVRAEMMVMNQGVAQQTKALHQLNITLTSLTTAVKRQTS